MTRLKSVLVLIVSMAAAAAAQQAPEPGERPSLAGTWSLNPVLSQFPKDIGFSVDLVPPGRPGENLGGRFAGALSEASQRNSRQLLDEIRNPPTQLAIAESGVAVTMTDERGRGRTLQTDGRETLQTLDGGPVVTVARWDGGRLVVRFQLGDGREIRHTYSLRPLARQLVVQSEVIERAKRTSALRIYEPGMPPDARPGPETRPAGRPGAPAVPPAERTGAGPGQPPPGAAPGGLVPAAPGPAGLGPLDQRPGAELIGLKTLGIEIEGLGPEAAACGLRQTAVESALVSSLTDAGLKVVRNADEDSYLYVSIGTRTMAAGFCVSRYDAFVYTSAPAAPSYGTRPVLAQVSLLHKGGLVGGAAATHGDQVVQALQQYIALFGEQIRAANK